MLQKWITGNVFLYGMGLSGIVGILGMLAIHLTYKRRLKHTGRLSNLKEKWLNLWKSRDRLLRGMNRFAVYCSLADVFFMGLALFAPAAGKLSEGLSMRFLYLGICIPLALLLVRQLLDFSYKEDLLVDSLSDYIDRAREKLEQLPQTKEDPGVQNEVVEQIARSIKESAAAGSRFSKMLTPEEELLLREIIREFMD